MASRNLSFFATKPLSRSLFISYLLCHSWTILLSLFLLIPHLLLGIFTASCIRVDLVCITPLLPASFTCRLPFQNCLSLGRFMFPPQRENGLIPFCCEPRELRVFFYTYAQNTCVRELRHASCANFSPRSFIHFFVLFLFSILFFISNTSGITVLFDNYSLLLENLFYHWFDVFHLFIQFKFTVI